MNEMPTIAPDQFKPSAGTYLSPRLPFTHFPFLNSRHKGSLGYSDVSHTARPPTQDFNPITVGRFLQK